MSSDFGPDDKPNGCGPWWYPTKWKDRYFEDACKVHDEDYMAGKDRKRSDEIFLNNMMQEAADGPWVRRLQAFVFYGIVRVFGWTSHKKGLDL